MKTKTAIVVLVIGVCLAVLAIYRFGERRPDKWSWDLVRNGKVYSYTQRTWVKYPMDTQGDGWALKEHLDAFHKMNGLPSIVWADEHEGMPAVPVGTKRAGQH